MNRRHSHRSGAHGPRRAAAFLVAAFLAAVPVALHTGCMGGSSGVDNPGVADLPVDFRDEAGDVALAQGTLEVYDREHNPAVASEPLLRLEISNRTGVHLTHEEFDRIGAARALNTVAAWKRSAGSAAGPVASDSLIRFNLVFRSATGSGAVATGLSYDPVSKTFSVDARNPAAGVQLVPKPLIRFAARLHREAATGDLGRVFLPGTPFQATLVDSDFALQNLPEGRFGMRMLGGGGYVYAVLETLDTQAGHSFTAAPDPIGRIDSVIAPVGFGVEAGGNLSANMKESVATQGRLLGADSNDSRLSILWRVLRPLSSDSALIAEPTRLNTQILFPAMGGYSVELAATLGATTVRDTVQYKVATTVIVAPAKFSAPQPGDTVIQGQLCKVAWNASALTGMARLEYSYQNGAEGTWLIGVDSIKIALGGTALWTAPLIAKEVLPCLLRLRMIPSDSVLMQIDGPIFLAR